MMKKQNLHCQKPSQDWAEDGPSVWLSALIGEWSFGCKLSGSKKLMRGQEKKEARGISMMDVERQEESQPDDHMCVRVCHRVHSMRPRNFEKNFKSDGHDQCTMWPSRHQHMYVHVRVHVYVCRLCKHIFDVKLINSIFDILSSILFGSIQISSI